MSLFSHIDKILSRLTEDETEKWLKFHDELDERYSEKLTESDDKERGKYGHVQVVPGKSDTEKLKDYLYDRLMKDILNDEGVKTIIKIYVNNGLSKDAAIKAILEQSEEIEGRSYDGWSDLNER